MTVDSWRFADTLGSHTIDNDDRIYSGIWSDSLSPADITLITDALEVSFLFFFFFLRRHIDSSAQLTGDHGSKQLSSHIVSVAGGSIHDHPIEAGTKNVGIIFATAGRSFSNQCTGRLAQWQGA